MTSVEERSAAPRARLLGAAAVLALGNILSRALGLARDSVIAATFGATAATDAFVLARTAPTILYDLLVGSVSTAAFVPVFVQHLQNDRQFWRIVGAVASLAVVAFTVLAAVLALLADPIMAIFGAGLPGGDAQRQLAASLMRISLISVVFQGLAGVLTSALYARNRFTLPAIATAIYNVGIIVAIVVLAPRLDVYALAIGLIVGAVAQCALQAAGLRALWRELRPRIDLDDPAVRQVLRLGATVAAGLLVTIAGQVIDRWLASHLAEGSMQRMDFATRIVQFPLGMVGLTMSFAVLPTLARYSGAEVSAASARGYRDALIFGLKLVLLLMLLALALVVPLAHPVVQVVFERGAFTPDDTARTTAILLAYAPMLPLTGIDYVLINAFYARQDPRTPVIVGVVCVLLYLVVALLTIQPFGPVGLAFANAVQNSSHAAILLVLLGRTIPTLRLSGALWPFLLRTLPSAAVTCIAVWLAWPSLAPLGPLVGLVVAALAGAVMYGGLLAALRVPELGEAVDIVRRRLR